MLKVLVIDDEVFVRKGIVMETDWASLGCMVAGEAANGLEGLEACHKYNPDLIISDIRMPKMDGIEMLKMLAFDYLQKPFEDGELEEAVNRVREKIEKERSESQRQEEEKILVSGGKPGGKSGYIKEAVAYITDHYSDSTISVGTIAESLGISEGHLSHLFKKETDYTVMAYITRCRIREAMKLLTNRRYRVYEVAEMVGYRDITYFSSTFKKIVGVSPSEYQDSAS